MITMICLDCRLSRTSAAIHHHPMTAAAKPRKTNQSLVAIMTASASLFLKTKKRAISKIMTSTKGLRKRVCHANVLENNTETIPASMPKKGLKDVKECGIPRLRPKCNVSIVMKLISFWQKSDADAPRTACTQCVRQRKCLSPWSMICAAKDLNVRAIHAFFPPQYFPHPGGEEAS